MRAVRCHSYKGPEDVSVDEVKDPGPPGAGDVAIDVRAAGVNFPDLLLSYGKYQFKPEPPFSPGGEGAGVVTAVGPGVTYVKPGDRVAFTIVHGTFVEKLVLPEGAVVKVPDGVSFEIASATLLTYLTTMHALVDRAALAKGETMLVLGAAGGVGVAAIHLGKILGAKVIAAAGSDEKVAFCKQMGADLGIVYTKEDLKERAKALTDGRGVDVTYDAVGGPYSEPAIRSMAWGGRHLVVGFAAGDIPKIPLNLALLKGCAIVGVFWGQFAMRDMIRNRAHGEQIFAWIAEGKLKPHLHAVKPFTEARAVLEELAARKVMGKAVLVP
jgi:NADPH2:quinone reductase